jgi:hypothetical protein
VCFWLPGGVGGITRKRDTHTRRARREKKDCKCTLLLEHSFLILLHDRVPIKKKELV